MMYYLKQIKSFQDVLPVFMVVLTKHDRERVGVEWSDKSWTHNLFRVYELIFWRRTGIRAELSSVRNEDGSIFYYYHSFEAVIAGIETGLRNFLKAFEINLPILIWTPQTAPCGGARIGSPYLFAIAFDASSESAQQTSTSSTWSHTITGSNTLLAVGNWSAGNLTTGATYNASSMTAIADVTNYLNSDHSYMWYKIAPTTGANNVVVSLSSSANNAEQATSFTGCKQSSQPDCTAYTSSGDGSSNTFSMTVTTVSDNCWLFGIHRSFDAGCSAGSSTIIRSNNGLTISDSNGARTPAGSQSLNYTSCGNRVGNKLMTAFAPYVAPVGPANLKTYNTNASANIKSMNTNLIANVKTLDTNV